MDKNFSFSLDVFFFFQFFDFVFLEDFHSVVVKRGFFLYEKNFGIGAFPDDA